MAENFTVYGFKPQGWEIGEPREKYLIEDGVEEPAMGVDAAEEWLAEFGVPGESYAELVFNGETEAHTAVFMLDDGLLGIFNSEGAKWPVFYSVGSGGGTMLDGYPEGFASSIEDDEQGDESGFGDEDENSEVMNLGSDDEESEDENGDDEDDGAEEDDSDEDDEDSVAESEEDEAAEEEEEDAEGDEDENEQGEGDEESDSDSSEDEMPRLNIFAKMRGPKGWRKRAVAEDLLDRNVFALKVGVLDPEAATPGKQEKNVVAHIEFIESDEDRGGGILRIKANDLTLEDFTETKSGWLTARVSYESE